MQALTNAYHFHDPSLFRAFLDGIEPHLLSEPFKKDPGLQKKYFRGRRIAGHSLRKDALANALRNQVVEFYNGKVALYLCANWIYAHAKSVEWLRSYVESESEPKLKDLRSWLPYAQQAFKAKLQQNEISRIVNALLIDWSVEQIKIVVSIIGAEVEDQHQLYDLVKSEIVRAETDPVLVRDRIRHQLVPIENEIQECKTSEEKITEQASQSFKEYSEQVRQIELDLGKIRKQVKPLEEERAQKQQELEEVSNKLNVEIQSLYTKLKPLTRTQEKLGKQNEQLEEEWQSQELEVKSDLEKLKSRRTELEQSQKQLRVELQDQDQRIKKMQQEQEQPPSVFGCTADQNNSDSDPVAWFTELISDVESTGFTSSSSTLDLLRAKREVGVKKVPDPKTRDGADSFMQEACYRNLALSSESLWDLNAITEYSYWRSIELQKGNRRDLAIEIIISGLYHAGRAGRAQHSAATIERLLGRLIESWARFPQQSDSSFINEVLRKGGDNPQALRSLGRLQMKLASASPAALNLLYEQLMPRPRVVAKKALVAQIDMLVEVDERDPTHELLEVICSTVSSILQGFSSALQIWRGSSHLKDKSEGRSLVLASAKKLTRLDNHDAVNALEPFRILMGPRLTKALDRNSHESYTELFAQCVDLLNSILQYPDWIGSRYLFPLVFELGRGALQAGDEIRKSLYADLSIELEKTQYPLSVASSVEIGLRILNRGNTRAQNVNLVVYPTHESTQTVQVKDKDASVSDIAPGEECVENLTISVNRADSAVQLEYLISWSHPSTREPSATGHLKVVGQKTIEWEKAETNPYSVLSVKEPKRLKGREETIRKLRMGVMTPESFSLTGQKRVGKSSVARVLCSNFANNPEFLSVYANLGELGLDSANEFIQALEKLLSDTKREAVDPSSSDEHSKAGAKFLIIIDDFDELPEKLYKGPEGNQLFLWLRSRIDNGNFAFIFVGSERLPQILRYQGEKLNQVRPINLDYLHDFQSLARLVRDPGVPFIEYSDEAVEFIWNISAGNPYYATQICNRVYEDMVGRKDHFVGKADVERGVRAKLSLADDDINSYQHFWTDGVFDAGPDSGRFQYINANLLIAIAELEGEDRQLLAKDRICKHKILNGFDQRVVSYRLDQLFSRQVVEQKEQQLRMRLPLLSRWLREGGATAVRASFAEEEVEWALAPTSIRISEEELIEVAKDLRYRGDPINEVLIRAWLKQFGNERSQKMMFRLLKYLKKHGYFGHQKTWDTFRSLHAQVVADAASSQRDWTKQVGKRGRVSNIIASCFDSAGKSGPAMMYEYVKANDIPRALATSMDQAVELLAKSENMMMIVFVDDFLGTGSTCVEGFKKFKEMLVDRSVDIDRHVLAFVALAGTESGANWVNGETAGRLPVYLGTELSSANRAFSPSRAIFDDDRERIAAESLCRAIGKALQPKHPLGYQDCQSLILFEHSCPNNTLPIFYKQGTYQGQVWKPLFPR